MLSSYGSPLALGHKKLEHLWDGEIYIQEKIDGSQFSFGLRDGEVYCRSRRQPLDTENPSGMFQKGILHVLQNSEHLREGWTYRGEFLGKPKHNTMAYDRVPEGNIILFDVDMGDQDYVRPGTLGDIARMLGIECCPMLLSSNQTWPVEELQSFLKYTSCLGGGPVEGIVIKNYGQFDERGKVLMAKLVSADFQEKHGKDWKKRNPTKKDIITSLIEQYATEARWAKAVQHLAESGKLEHSPRDIGLLIREVPEDILAEHGDEIRDALFKAFIKDLRRGWTRGLPEWYKRELLEQAL